MLDSESDARNTFPTTWNRGNKRLRKAEAQRLGKQGWSEVHHLIVIKDIATWSWKHFVKMSSANMVHLQMTAFTFPYLQLR